MRSGNKSDKTKKSEITGENGVRLRAWLSLGANVLTVILVTYSMICYFVTTGDGNMQVTGTDSFMFFTNDSNILAALACLAVIPFDVIAIRRGEWKLPRPALVIKYVGTSAVALTFLTVVFFLAPITPNGFVVMFAGNVLWLHLICPLLCIFSLAFLETSEKLNFTDTIFGTIPTVVYGAVYFVMVVVIGAGNGGWADFYHFNMGGRWYLAVIFMVTGSYLISVLLRLWCNAVAGKKKNIE